MTAESSTFPGKNAKSGRSYSLLGLGASFWKHRALVGRMISQEVRGKYKGSFLGMAWSLIQPLFMLLIYTFVFSVIFKARWGVGDSNDGEFAVVLFIGLIMYGLFAETMIAATGTILGHRNYVNKVVFPLEILPIVALGSSLARFIFAFAVWFPIFVFVFGVPELLAALFPITLIPLILWTLGLSYFFASIGTYFRDANEIVVIVTSGLLFLSPIFYPMSALPEPMQPVLALSPLAQAIDNARAVLFGVQQINWVTYSSSCVTGLIVTFLGFAWFQKTRDGFADVL